MNDSPLHAAKDRLPIPALWSLLGLQGKPGRECFCPFHDNTDTPAGSVFEKGGELRFNCFSGCTPDGSVDSGGFLGLALGLGNAEACQKLIDMAGLLPAAPPRTPAPVFDDGAERAAKRAGWPAFVKPSGVEIRAIACLRNLGAEAVRILADRGLLFCCDSVEGRAWVVTDASRRNAQARRMDGKPWERIKAKAWTLPGSEAGWPVGMREAFPFQAIALVEGGPDMVSAVHLAWCANTEDEVAPVAILGAANRIPDDALALFAGKRVRIFGHADKSGQAAAARWAGQLAGAGAEVDGFNFSGLIQSEGKPVKDLNDFCHVDVEQWEEQREEIEQAFTFAPRFPTIALSGAGARQVQVATCPAFAGKEAA